MKPSLNLLTIYKGTAKLKGMSKKSGKGKKSQKHEIEEEDNLVEESSTDSISAAVEIGYLTTAIIEYYESIKPESLEDGDEWKSGTKYEPKAKSHVPSELDVEIRKAFLIQIKKFQK